MLTFVSPLAADLNEVDWQEQIVPKQLSLEDTLDLLGDAKTMLAFAKKFEGYMKEVVRTKMPEGEDEYVGHHFRIALNERFRAGGLNKDLILEEMGEDWVEEHSKEPTEYIEIRVTRVDPDEVE